MNNALKTGVSSTALKALRTLELVSECREPVTARELAELMVCDKVTAYRMLLTLEVAGYITREPSTNRFSLSHKVVSLSRNLLAENEVSRTVMSAMRELSLETQETLHYSVLVDAKAVLVGRVKGTQLVAVEFQVGDRTALHCTSIGKVLLAYQDAHFVDRVISEGLSRSASKTIVDGDALRAELERIRAQGYAFDDHEFSDNMRCVAAPLFDSRGRVTSGLSISGPDSRFDQSRLNALRDILIERTRSLSRRLGGIPWENAPGKGAYG